MVDLLLLVPRIMDEGRLLGEEYLFVHYQHWGRILKESVRIVLPPHAIIPLCLRGISFEIDFTAFYNDPFMIFRL